MVNKIILIGFAGGDPDVRTLENGTRVGRFSLATSESYKDKSDNWQTQTEWHNIVVWREMAERAEKNLKKGMQVFVEGKVSYRKFADKQTGEERTVTDIVASAFRILERKETTPAPETQQPAPTQQPPSNARQVADPGAPFDAGDLPF